MRVLIAVSGGIAAYKVADIISGFKANGWETHVVMTENAKKFITPTVIGALADKYITEDDVNEITHIDEAQACDMFLTVPATANIIGKYANGIADDLVSTINLAVPKTTLKIYCPAMNTKMLFNPAVIANMKKLTSYGFYDIPSIEGILACGDKGPGKLPKPRDIVNECLRLYNLYYRTGWIWPLDSQKGKATSDSYSFLDYLNDEREIDLTRRCDIPLHPHVGSFGVRRRHDHHKGVDLYAPDGAKVKAVEDGIVMEVCPFTGPSAGYPWWNDTEAVYIKGRTGIVVYGEIMVNKDLREGQFIKAGQHIGNVKTVLKNDKGRPMSMLHLALHDKDTLHNGDWCIGEPKPKGLLNPTQYLINSIEI
jgi:3-polyprenyl-4-hydroxybenzoate decarboxylase